MEYKELYYTLQDIFPDYAKEILKGLFLLNDGLEKTKDSIGNIPYKILKENNNLNKITDMENKIDDLLKAIAAMNIDINTYPDCSDKYNGEKDELINSSVPERPINEKLFQKMDFTGTKPIKFKLLGEEREVTSWKDLFFFVCEYLSSLDLKIFDEFVHNSEFRGRTRWYFSYDEKQISTPEIINNTNIYAEKNLPANVIRDILIKMFKKYSIQGSDFQVYLKSGYKSKRGINKDKDENDKLTKYIIDTMRPVNQKRTVGLSQKENKKLDEFMGTKSHIGFVKMKEDHKRTKNRCTYYDKILSCCLCKKSPYLHTHCGNISHCDFYKEKNAQDEDLNSNIGSIREVLGNDVIYVIQDNNNEVVCPHCHGKLRPRILSLLDKTDNKRVSLNGYECVKCHDQFSCYQDVTNLQKSMGLHSLGSKIY